MIKNEEGYADPTYGGAYKAIRQEEKRKQDEADADRMEKAIHRAKAVFKEAGFEVVERIVLKNTRTGKIYRYLPIRRKSYDKL
nr:MAG TPA: hypothetical protein [Caudoviricetes sp.]